MKVLHIIWNAKFGGIEKIVFELAEEQLNSSEVVPAVLISKEEGEFLGRFKQADFSTHFLAFKKGFDLSYSNFKNALGLFKDHDVLHFHFFNPILALAAHLSKKKVVYTEHGNFGFGRKEKKYDALLNSLKKKFLENQKIHITFNSNFTKVLAHQLYLKPDRQNATVVYNGIDFEASNGVLNSSSRSDVIVKLEQQLKGNIVIGTASRFAGVKKNDRLISAFSKLKDKKNVKLLFVGSGIKLDDYKIQVEKLGIKDHVIFAGYIKEVREAQQLMDICVIPSQNESFGLVAIETLSIGKPTLVFYDGGGLVEIIEGINKDDVAKDEDCLVERIDYYRSNIKEIGLSMKTRIEYSKKFSIRSVADNLVSIYQQK